MIDYRDITIRVNCEKYTVSIIYKGGGGLHLPFNHLDILYPVLFRGTERNAGKLSFWKKEICDGEK